MFESNIGNLETLLEKKKVVRLHCNLETLLEKKKLLDSIEPSKLIQVWIKYETHPKLELEYSRGRCSKGQVTNASL